MTLLVLMAIGCSRSLDERPTPRQHVVRWHELKIGMTEAEVVALLGRPDDGITAQTNRRYRVPHMLLWGWTVPLDDSPARFVGLTNAYRIVLDENGTVARWGTPGEME